MVGEILHKSLSIIENGRKHSRSFLWKPQRLASAGGCGADEYSIKQKCAVQGAIGVMVVDLAETILASSGAVSHQREEE